MEVTKFWTKTKVIILFVILLIIGLIVGGYFLRKNKMIKEYIDFENKINNNVVNYLSLEGIELEQGEYRKIDIKKIIKSLLSKNKYKDDCSGYSIAEYKKSGIDSTTYVKCKSVYTTPGYGNESNKKENTDKAQSENDTTKPVITLLGKKEMTIALNEKFKDPGATATDNVDGDLTDEIKVTGEVDITKEGTYTLKYTVSDKTGNKATKNRTVIVKKSDDKSDGKDKISPVITFKNTSLVQNVCIGEKVNVEKDGPYAYTAYDDVDGNITDKVKIEGKLDKTTTIGTYTLTYTVKDSSKNEAKVTRDYVVTDCSKPVTPVTPTPTPDPDPDPTPTPTPTPDPTPTPTPTPTPDPGPVEIPVISIIAPDTLYVSVGETESIGAYVLPSNATNQSLSYSVDNPSIASVDSYGNVRGINYGSTRVVITSSNGRQVGVFIEVD